MKLLLDQNLSPKLVQKLSDLFPDSAHVSDLGLDTASDQAIWEYAHAQEFIIVTKDADFSEFSVVWGIPPQILWVRRGNCTTNDIETILRDNIELITEFSGDYTLGILTLY